MALVDQIVKLKEIRPKVQSIYLISSPKTVVLYQKVKNEKLQKTSNHYAEIEKLVHSIPYDHQHYALILVVSTWHRTAVHKKP